MRCRTCEYPLWNLLARRCPECGAAFKPSDYRFAINSVAYCCPHCDQRYYGTDESGHLTPRSFACVTCDRQIEMDEMRLLPADGVDERHTGVDVNPWHDPTRRPLRRWISTLVRGVTNPMWLLRSTPVDADAASAWWFAILTHLVIALCAVVPMGVMAVVLGAGAGGVAGSGLLFAFGAVVVSTVGLAVWAVVTHLVLRLTGRTEGGMGRTAQALCFTCAPQFILVVPCVNIYLGWTGAIWWTIAAAFALAAAQRVGGLRAAVAVAAFPLLAGAGVVAWVAVGVSTAVTATAGWTPANAESVSSFAPAIRRAVADGEPPTHALQFLIDGEVIPGQFVARDSATSPEMVTVAGVPLTRVAPGAAAESLAQSAAAALPPGAPAHRVGDFVFALDAIAHAQTDPELWVVVEAWDPSLSPVAQSDVHVLAAGGGVSTFSRGALWLELERQNAARAAVGLPPLPDPFKVRATTE